MNDSKQKPPIFELCQCDGTNRHYPSRGKASDVPWRNFSQRLSRGESCRAGEVRMVGANQLKTMEVGTQLVGYVCSNTHFVYL